MTRISILLIFTLLFILVAGEEESVSGGDVEVSRLIRSPEGKKNQRQTKKKKKTSRSKKKKRGKEKKRTGKKKTGKGKKKSTNENKKKKRGSRKESRNGGGGKCGRQSGADDSTCLANIGTVYDYIATQITNFEKQKKNVDRFKDIMTRKGGKKDNFANSTSFISSACTGNTEASSNLATLNNCSTSINSGCTLPTVDEDTLASCQTSFDGVESKNDECYQQMIAESADLSAACTCYAEAAKLVEDTKALKCSAVDEFNKLRDAKNECLDKFKACKKAEDASVGLIHVCNGGTTPATTTAATTTTTTEVPVSTTTAAGGATTTTTAAVTTAAGAATTTTTVSDDEVTTRVKGYIDAGTCGTISFGEFDTSVCGDAASSYYKEFTYNGKRVIISNNIPDHAAEHDMLNANPNLRCPGWQFISMPINPGKGSSITDTGLGTIGLAVTGGVFFNDLSNPDGSLAMANEGTSLDSCLGHSAPTGSNGGGGGRPPPGGRKKRQSNQPGQYHYHGNINCTNAGAATGANNPDSCKLIGYYRDGVPVYGLCKDSSGNVFTSCYKLNSGATTTTVVTAFGTYTVGTVNSDYTFTSDTSCNLDEANGAVHPSTGQYSYFMTTGYPWTPIKFAGDQGQSNYCSAS